MPGADVRVRRQARRGGRGARAGRSGSCGRTRPTRRADARSGRRGPRRRRGSRAGQRSAAACPPRRRRARRGAPSRDVEPSAETVSSSGSGSGGIRASRAAIASWSETGSGKRSGGADGAVLDRDAARELERVERIAARDLVDPAQSGPRDRLRLGAQNLPERVRGRAARARGSPRGRVEGWRPRRAGPPRRLRGATRRAGRSARRPGAGTRSAARAPTRSRATGRRRPRPRSVLAAARRRRVSSTARPRTSGSSSSPSASALDGHVLEQVDQPHQRERHLLLGRPGDEDVEARRAGSARPRSARASSCRSRTRRGLSAPGHRRAASRRTRRFALARARDPRLGLSGRHAGRRHRPCLDYRNAPRASSAGGSKLGEPIVREREPADALEARRHPALLRRVRLLETVQEAPGLSQVVAEHALRCCAAGPSHRLSDRGVREARSRIGPLAHGGASGPCRDRTGSRAAASSPRRRAGSRLRSRSRRPRRS